MRITDLLNPLEDEEKERLSEKETSKKPEDTIDTSSSQPLFCSICYTTFKKKPEYVRHMKTIHPRPDAVWYICPNPGCDKKYTRVDALRSHLRSQKAKKYKCQPPNYFLMPHSAMESISGNHSPDAQFESHSAEPP
jgi:uncharacterized Zn-finger protein